MLEIEIGSFPVRVSISFLLLPLIFALDLGLVAMIVAGLALFATVLIHELGHAWTVRRLGGRVSDVTLYAMGGVTLWTDPAGVVTGWRRAAVAAAGSGIQVPVALLVWVLARRGVFGQTARAIDNPWDFGVILAAARFEEWLVMFLATFVVAGFVFGLFNWLPIGGLDGYHMTEIALEGMLGPGGHRHAAFVSLIVGGAVAYVTYQSGRFQLLPLFVVYLAVQPLFTRR